MGIERMRGLLTSAALIAVLAWSQAAQAQLPCANEPAATKTLCERYCQQGCDRSASFVCILLRYQYAARSGGRLPRCSVPTPTRTRTPTRTPTRTTTPTRTAPPTPQPCVDQAPVAPPPGVVAFTTSACSNADTGTIGPRPGSIVIFPKIEAGTLFGGRDTIIRLTNTSNVVSFARCLYLTAVPLDPSQPPGPANPALWQSLDFMVPLTAQQPVQWHVASGRGPGPGSPAGFLGNVPAVPQPFNGQLRCVEVDASGVPISLNALSGVATLRSPNGDVSSYDAVALRGNVTNNSDLALRLDDVEYSACPPTLYATLPSEGSEDPVLGNGSTTSSRLTLVPCDFDFQSGSPATLSPLGIVANEYGQIVSTQFLLTGWFDQDLTWAGFGSVFNASIGDARSLELRRSTSPRCSGGASQGALCVTNADCLGFPCRRPGGFVGVLETTRRDGLGRNAHSIELLQGCGSAPEGQMTLPPTP